MKKLSIATFFILFWVSTFPLQAETLFHDDFSDGDNWKGNWYHLGSEGGKIIQVDGHLEIVGGELMKSKQTSAVTKEKFDFTNGTTFEGVTTSAGVDQNQFWVAQNDGEGQAEDDPWFTINWFRVLFEGNSIWPDRAKPVGEGMQDLPKIQGETPVGTPYKMSIYMDKEDFKVYLDGEEIASGKHEQNFTKAHFIWGVWTMGGAVEENYKLDNVFVYEGDYDPNPSLAVKSEGKLAVRWSSIKVQH